MRLVRKLTTVVIVTAVMTCLGAVAADATQRAKAPELSPLAVFGSGLGSGSTIGPDGALYVTDGNAGKVWRIDTRSGAVTQFASGLPPQVLGIGGAMDIAFLGHTAYVLVTLVGGDIVDGPHIGDDDRRHLPPREERHLQGGRRHRCLVGRPSSGHRLLHHDGRAVRAGGDPRRLPRDRRTPQPRPVRVEARRHHRADHVREHRPDRARDVGRQGVHGAGRPGAAPAGNGRVVSFRQDCGNVARGGEGSQHDRRRRARRPQALRPVAGKVGRRGRGLSGLAEHRPPREGARTTAASRPWSTGRARRSCSTVPPRSSSSGTRPTSSRSAVRW